jgi:hypothetical protein
MKYDSFSHPFCIGLAFMKPSDVVFFLVDGEVKIF